MAMTRHRPGTAHRYRPLDDRNSHGENHLKLVAPLGLFALIMGCVLVEILSALAALILIVRLMGLVRSFSVRINIDIGWPPKR